MTACHLEACVQCPFFTMMCLSVAPCFLLCDKLTNIARLFLSFAQVLRQCGVRVLTVREILAYGVEEHMGARVELEDLVLGVLTYQMAAGHKEEDLTEADRFYLSDQYKRQVSERLWGVQALPLSETLACCVEEHMGARAELANLVLEGAHVLDGGRP